MASVDSTYLPGRYRYNNSGYAVLAMIAEKVSGMPSDFLEENVFRPRA